MIKVVSDKMYGPKSEGTTLPNNNHEPNREYGMAAGRADGPFCRGYVVYKYQGAYWPSNIYIEEFYD